MDYVWKYILNEISLIKEKSRVVTKYIYINYLKMGSTINNVETCIRDWTALHLLQVLFSVFPFFLPLAT
jgi:hypothetical protein